MKQKQKFVYLFCLLFGYTLKTVRWAVVAYLFWIQNVGGSNPSAQTIGKSLESFVHSTKISKSLKDLKRIVSTMVEYARLLIVERRIVTFTIRQFQSFVLCTKT